MYTAAYTTGTFTRLCHVHGLSTVVHTTRVNVYTAITPPCTRRARDVYTAVTRPCTGRVHGRVWAVHTACVHDCVQAVCMAVFSRVHGAYTTSTPPFSAVYLAHTRPCNCPCTWPLHGHEHGPRTQTCTRLLLAPHCGGQQYYVTRPCTCGVHDGPCTRSCTRPVYGPLTQLVRSV